MVRVTISEQDVKNPDRLRRKLGDAYAQLYNLTEQLQGVLNRLDQSSDAGITPVERSILQALSIGSTESSAASQKPVVPTVDTKPPTNTATPGDLIRLSTDGVIYVFVGESTQDWVSISAAASAHNILSATHGDTVAAAVVRGDLIVGNSTPKWARLVKGTALQLLRMNAGATDPEWGGVDDGQLSANVALLNAGNVFTSGQVFGASTPIHLGGTVITNSAELFVKFQNEEITLSTVGTTTDSATNLIAAPGVIWAVLGYFTQTVSGGGVTQVQIGDATTAGRFFTTLSISVGNSFNGWDQWRGSVNTDAAGPHQYTAAKIRITCNATPTQGKVRIVTCALVSSAPTS